REVGLELTDRTECVRVRSLLVEHEDLVAPEAGARAGERARRRAGVVERVFVDDDPVLVVADAGIVDPSAGAAAATRRVRVACSGPPIPGAGRIRGRRDGEQRTRADARGVARGNEDEAIVETVEKDLRVECGNRSAFDRDACPE